MDVEDKARVIGRGGRDADLLAVIFEQPHCRIATIVDRCDVSRQTAMAWLNQLVDLGILESNKVGRDRLFVNRRFLEILTRDDPVS